MTLKSSPQPLWKVGPWSNCTGSNNTETVPPEEDECTQYQFRNVFCEQIVSNNVGSVVEDNKCFEEVEELGEKPQAFKECDEVLEGEEEEEQGPQVRSMCTLVYVCRF